MYGFCLFLLHVLKRICLQMIFCKINKKKLYFILFYFIVIDINGRGLDLCGMNHEFFFSFI